jgi:transposase InsO family protein
MGASPELVLAGAEHVMACMCVHGSRPDASRRRRHRVYLCRFATAVVEGQTSPLAPRRGATLLGSWRRQRALSAPEEESGDPSVAWQSGGSPLAGGWTAPP